MKSGDRLLRLSMFSGDVVNVIAATKGAAPALVMVAGQGREKGVKE